MQVAAESEGTLCLLYRSARQMGDDFLDRSVVDRYVYVCDKGDAVSLTGINMAFSDNPFLKDAKAVRLEE